MNQAQLLGILATNRELIQQNNRHTLEMLATLNTIYKETATEECVLSIELNNSMVHFYFYSDYNKAIENSERILAIYGATNHYNFLAWHLWLTGHCYAAKGDAVQAKKNLQQAADTIKDIKENSCAIEHEIFHSLAMSNHFEKGDSQLTLTYLQQALEAVLAIKDHIRIANCLMGMGNVYLEIKQAHEAQTKYQAAIHIYNERLDWQNLGSAYSNAGLCYLIQGNKELAAVFLKKALHLQLKNSAPEQLGNTLFNLATLYKECNDWQQASNYLLQCQQIITTTGSKYALQELQLLKQQISQMNLAIAGLN